MHLLYHITKGILQFVANLLRYIPTKHYSNSSTFDLDIVKRKGVPFFETQCIYD